MGMVMKYNNLKRIMGLTAELHRIDPTAQYDTPEQEAAWERIADESEPYWYALTPEEADVAREHSAALYALHDLNMFLTSRE